MPCQPWKSCWAGGLPHIFFSFRKFFLQFSRHGVGASSYITNLSDKQASKHTHTKQTKKVFSYPKGGGGGGGWTPSHTCLELWKSQTYPKETGEAPACIREHAGIAGGVEAFMTRHSWAGVFWWWWVIGDGCLWRWRPGNKISLSDLSYCILCGQRVFISYRQ